MNIEIFYLVYLLIYVKYGIILMIQGIGTTQNKEETRMKNQLDILTSAGNVSKFRNIENFQSLPNGTATFKTSDDTKFYDRLHWTKYQPVGAQLTVHSDYIYEDYTSLPDGELLD